jgi:chromosome segregation ATPase
VIHGAKVEVAKAGARKTLVEADVTLSDHALQHLKEIKLDYAKEREDNNNLRRELQDTRDELDTAKETLIRLDSKVKHLTFELEKRDETIKQKDIEIEQLMLEIKRYKNSHGGRPH